MFLLIRICLTINCKSPFKYLMSLMCSSKNQQKLRMLTANDKYVKYNAVRGCSGEYFDFKVRIGDGLLGV